MSSKTTFSSTKATCDARAAELSRQASAGAKIAPQLCVAASVARPTDVRPFTANCSLPQNSVWYFTSRREGCIHTAYQWTVVEVPSQIVKGQGKINLTMSMTSTTAYAEWGSTVGATLDTGYTNGAATPSSVSGTLFGCSTSGPVSCPSSSNWTVAATNPATGNQVAWTANGAFDPVGIPAGQASVFYNSGWDLTITANWGSFTAHNGLAITRCDNAGKSGYPATGCIVNIPALVGFSQSKLPEFVRHISEAQTSGLPGVMNSGYPLHYLADATLTTKNGNTACPTGATSPIRPTPTGKQCDEYPFRSTKEGAYTGSLLPGGGTRTYNPRTQSWCQMPNTPVGVTGQVGYSRCYIDAFQNQSAGTPLRVLYGDQRLLDGDPYYVGYTS